MAMWVYWLCCGRSSLSARRAWIEILAAGRKAVEKGSLSARRAWIEIFFLASCLFVRLVALRKESVDRNRGSVAGKSGTLSRSPQGEHGMFLFLTVQGGFVHADIRFNLKNCYSKKLSHKII